MSDIGDACSWNYQCLNNACGRDHNTSKKICCPTDTVVSGAWGLDYCSNYAGGEECSQNNQCKSGVCNADHMCTCTDGKMLCGANCYDMKSNGKTCTITIRD